MGLTIYVLQGNCKDVNCLTQGLGGNSKNDKFLVFRDHESAWLDGRREGGQQRRAQVEQEESASPHSW